MGTISAIFDLQVTQIVPIKFRVIGFSVQEKKFQTDFQMVLGFQIGMTLVIFFSTGLSDSYC